MNVTPIDWAIAGGFFVALLTLAIWINGQCKSVADYLVSGRKVRLFLGMGAGVAGEIGLVTIVAICEQGYMRGFGFVLIGLLSMMITVPLFGYFGFGIERFRATKAMSVPQYIEMRYSRRLRILTGFFNSIAGIFQMCVFPIVGAGFLRVLIDAPEAVTLMEQTVPTTWLIMGILLSCAALFTYFGGYVTLVVTNFFQMIVIMAAIYWLFGNLVSDIGLQHLWSTLEQTKGLPAFYPFAKGENAYGIVWFSWMMTMTVLLQFSYGPYLQKYASMDKPKTVSRAYLIGSLFGNGRTFVIIGIGVCAMVMLGTKPPEGLDVTAETWQSMATPYYLAQVVPPVLMGLLLAGLLFADISTTDQYMLSWATSIVNDCICPFLKQPLTPQQHIRAIRLTILGMCILFFAFGVFYEPTIPLWEYMWLCGNIIGGTGVAVLFGMYWRRTTTTGAYAAVLVCMIVPLIDLIARRVYLAYGEGAEFPLRPETTGLYTYLTAIAVLVMTSLASNKETGYWDLGKAVRELNQ